MKEKEKQSKTPEGARVFPKKGLGKVQAGMGSEDSLGNIQSTVLELL